MMASCRAAALGPIEEAQGAIATASSPIDGLLPSATICRGPEASPKMLKKEEEEEAKQLMLLWLHLDEEGKKKNGWMEGRKKMNMKMKKRTIVLLSIATRLLMSLFTPFTPQFCCLWGNGHLAPHQSC
jgi:hypothetical protein